MKNCGYKKDLDAKPLFSWSMVAESVPLGKDMNSGILNPYPNSSEKAAVNRAGIWL